MNKQIIHKFFSGKTSDEESGMVLDWMEESEENKKSFLQERKLYDMAMLAGDDVFSSLSSGNKVKIMPYIKKIAQIAAIFILAFILSYYYFSSKKQDQVLTMNTITVPAGQRVNLTLGDGTNVWLNARSTLQYPTSFTSGKRELRLDGEAYFEVSKDKKKPFVVKTKKYSVEVLGTRFNLRAYSENEAFETALMEGSVKIESDANTQSPLVLIPNHLASEKNGQLHISPITDYDPFRWKEGLICFRNQSFNQIIYEFEKTYGTKIIVKNEKVLDRFYTGKFRQSDGIEHALRALQLSISFQFRRDDENNIIYIN